MAEHRKLYHRIFETGIFLKGINGVIETIGGVLLLSVKIETLHSVIIWLSLLELPLGNHDVVAEALRHFADEFSASTRLLGAIYLLGHGLIKIGLVAALQLKRLWAYPIAIGFTALFVVYQTYRLTLHFSPLLALLTCFDICLIWFIANEMKTARELSATSAPI
ncbi:DUF2127 domain-containing protein [soil metagenome]